MHPVMVRSYDGGTDIVVLGSDDSGLLFLLCLIVALILFTIYKLLQL
nr:E5 BETA protein [human papillomavirus 62]